MVTERSQRGTNTPTDERTGRLPVSVSIAVALISGGETLYRGLRGEMPDYRASGLDDVFALLFRGQ